MAALIMGWPAALMTFYAATRDSFMAAGNVKADVGTS